MRKVYIKPETTAIQTDCERNLMAASGEPIYTSVASDYDYATEASYGKGNSGFGKSIWDD